MGDLLFEHRGHQVRHGPHALADLRAARKPAFQTDIDIPVFVSRNPCGLLHVALADHRTRFHRGVHFVAGAIEEARVDEDDAFAGSADAFLEVDRGAALLVHDAHLHRVRRHTERLFDASEDFAGKGDLFRPMHLRLDDIHGAGARIHAASVGADVMERDKARDEGVHDAFGTSRPPSKVIAGLVMR